MGGEGRSRRVPALARTPRDLDSVSLADGATLPWSWYADRDVFELEQERIFRRSWQYVGHEGDIPRGGYFAAQLGRLPIVLTRDGEGVLRAFINVCRHRGAVLVDGTGRRQTMQCGYHAWTYALDGALRAAPRADREAKFDAAELSLVPARAAQWGPFLFATADAEADPLEATLGRLPELVADAGVDVDALRFHSRSQYELAANWKIAAENYLECYHCPVAHAAFSALVDVDPDAYRLEADELFSSQFAPLRPDATAPFDARGEIRRGQFHFVWPNTKINMVPGRPNISIGPLLPVDAGHTVGFLDYFFAPDADDAWIRELLAFDDEVGREDAVLVERVQRGAGIGALERGRLLLSSEQLIHHWHRLYVAALGRA